MTEAQIQLQNALTTTFLANLAFLSEYDNLLYHRVDELSRMIENGTYQEKYALEFIMESGDFDIYDIVNDRYLYNKNPKKINDDLIKKVDFDSKYSIVYLPTYFFYKKQLSVRIKDIDFDYKNKEELIELTQNDMWEYANALNDFLEKEKKKIKKVDKFIFLGTLLGRHIPKIAEKINSKLYLVLERNLEIFRLSLFTVDYTILAEKGVIFSIMDNIFDEQEKIFNFFKIGIIENYRIKFSTTNINIDEYVDNILIRNYKMNPVNYDYNRRLYIFMNRATEYINKYNFLLFNQIVNCQLFEKIPILYIAAGPSLDENLEWIKKNQNKFFIVTIGAAYKKLLSNNIKIDMITTVDEKEELTHIQFDDESVSKLSENTIILASVITNKNILKKFNQKNLFLFELYFPLHKQNIAFDANSVGELTVDILLKFNPKEIYMIGLDMALNQITGDSHAKNSGSGVATIFNLEKKQKRRDIFAEDTIINVKGNLIETVHTITRFFICIKNLEEILEKNQNTKIYNLSVHGAYFEGTIPIHVEDLKIEKFDLIKFDYYIFNNFLHENSSSKLSSDSVEIFKNNFLFLKEIIESDLKDLKVMKFKFYEDFEEQILLLIDKIYENKCLIIHQILFEYLRMVFPYLSYHFNDVGVKNEYKQVEKIKEISLKQIEKILEDYTSCLVRIIN